MSQKKHKESVLFFREPTFETAKLIFESPNKTFHIRLLEKETGFSTTAVLSAVKELQKFKIISAKKTPLTTNIKADLDSEEYRFYKIIFNLYILKQYSIIDSLISAFNNPTAIVLFGSYAKGEDIEGSDIDFLIITAQKEKNDIEMFALEFEDITKRKINFHILPSLDKSSTEFKNSVANGIVLHGYLRVI